MRKNVLFSILVVFVGAAICAYESITSKVGPRADNYLPIIGTIALISGIVMLTKNIRDFVPEPQQSKNQKG